MGQENGKNTFYTFYYFDTIGLYGFSINFLFNSKIFFDKIDNDALVGIVLGISTIQRFQQNMSILNLNQMD